MEGGHYQKAINAAIIRGHISDQTKIWYANYASNNPIESVQTLASGSMGEEGIESTYMITKVILEKNHEHLSLFPATNDYTHILTASVSSSLYSMMTGNILANAIVYRK